LIRDALPSGVAVRDLCEHRLKDRQRPKPVFQLTHSDLPSGFLPLQSLDVMPKNLPLQLTSFVGRESELNDVKDMVDRTYLLTLAGPSGTGKTRLSLQVAAELVDLSKPSNIHRVDRHGFPHNELGQAPSIGVRRAVDLFVKGSGS
jgi:hypothetical protein